jgi:hypothetical protein
VLPVAGATGVKALLVAGADIVRVTVAVVATVLVQAFTLGSDTNSV